MPVVVNTHERLPEVDSWAFAIGSEHLEKGALRRLSQFDLVVIDGDDASRRLVKKLKKRGVIVLAYVSVGTIEPWRPWADDAEKFLIRDEAGDPVVFEDWGEPFADVNKPGLRRLYANEIAPAMLRKGFDGLFLDNVDMIWSFPDRAPGMKKIVRRLNRVVDRRGGLLFAQNGWGIIDDFVDQLDGWNREDVTSTYDFDAESYIRQDELDTTEALEEVQEALDDGLMVLTTDYVDENDEESFQVALSNSCMAGALPYVSDILLSRFVQPQPCVEP